MKAGVLVEQLVSESAPGRVAEATEMLAHGQIEEIEASLPRALAGDRGEVRIYVAAYRTLTERVLEAVDPATPQWSRTALEQGAMRAPFSEWVASLGAGRGTAVAVVTDVRAMVPGSAPVTPPRNHRLPAWDLEGRDVMRFYRAVVDELSRTETPLDQIASALGLSRTELARLFGVRRQAIEQWEARGVPAERREKLATVGEIADLLAAKLKRDRIPGVVRRPADAYRGRSILDAIAAGHESAVLDELREAFDWAAAA